MYERDEKEDQTRSKHESLQWLTPIKYRIKSHFTFTALKIKTKTEIFNVKNSRSFRRAPLTVKWRHNILSLLSDLEHGEKEMKRKSLLTTSTWREFNDSQLFYGKKIVGTLQVKQVVAQLLLSRSP